MKIDNRLLNWLGRCLAGLALVSLWKVMTSVYRTAVDRTYLAVCIISLPPALQK